VKAKRPAAIQLTPIPISMTENTARTPPKLRAASGETAPRGIGRPQVRFMIASMSRSYHMLMAPEAPAPTAMQRTATAASTGSSPPGATISPAKPLNTTSDITRGFSSSMKSATRAPVPCASAPTASVEMATSDTATLVLVQCVHWHHYRASFDKLRIRSDLGGTKKEPHPELVEGRPAAIPATINDARWP